ncbi:MAG: Mss4p nuclear export [Thelocarpon superellum]|nr:MAG: Mss4p nuclear export [Thelocarpon superellum]
MGKRKHARPDELREVSKMDHDPKDSDSGDDEDLDMVNVDFEWFDPQPAHDFHGMKTLLRQLFDVDAELFDLSALADLILSQPLLGSTVKVDGNETDPYAFLTVLNLHQHRDVPVIKALIRYVADRSQSSSASQLRELLRADSGSQVGLILTERLVNVPAEVVPPMYAMLLEEISWAVEEKEPYAFSHYLVLSKTYLEVPSALDQEDHPAPKKAKKASSDGELFYFHPEDEVLHRHAQAHATYAYAKEKDEGHSDSKRAFQELGIKPQGHVILIEASKFEGAVKAVERFLQPS